jgi:predicted nucleic acid-binding protein
MPPLSMRVIVNTSPLIALDRIGRLPLLARLYDHVVRPQAVLDELLAAPTRIRDAETLLHTSWIATEPNPPAMILRKELGAGETAVLTLAWQSKADLVILDDLQARLVAASLGLKLTGTLGVLLAAARVGYEPNLSQALDDLQAAGFHVTDALRQQIRNTLPSQTMP